MGNILEATILIEKFQGEVLLPRIPMIPSDSAIPFKRLQFPIRLAFAITINKSQAFISQSTNVIKNSIVNVALYHIHHIRHYRVRLRESGQHIGRLRKTCKNAFPRKIPVSIGRLDTPIATESSLNVHFF
ncbi:hypothetical protein TNCV_4585701 [Trichonephila clavipes]|nr:hypothetical protein TNCV_4585701 [Trichonephila clavipes]